MSPYGFKIDLDMKSNESFGVLEPPQEFLCLMFNRSSSYCGAELSSYLETCVNIDFFSLVTNGVISYVTAWHRLFSLFLKITSAAMFRTFVTYKS